MHVISAPEFQEIELRLEVLDACRTGRARLIRERAGISQQDIATALGTDAAAVSGWENGRRRPVGKRAVRYGQLLRLLEERVGEI
jgi:DNA-binding transcriptional regulator YiaG